MELKQAVERAKAGDLEAFTYLVDRFQYFALGCAYAVLRDFQWAEDAVQDAFMGVFLNLRTLAEPGAFPGWLRGIVRHCSHRILRKQFANEQPLDDLGDRLAAPGNPEQDAERKEVSEMIFEALEKLPAEEREVMAQFYMHERSQKEIAAFLELPVTTVNNRLHNARKKLRKNMIQLVKSIFKEHKLSPDFPARIGEIARVRGPAIDVRLTGTAVPELLSTLAVQGKFQEVDLTVEVAQHAPQRIVRCIASSGAEQFRPGMKMVPASRKPGARRPTVALERAASFLAKADSHPGEFVETGIKVVDLLCPLAKGGRIGLFGPHGAGKLVLLEELVQNVALAQEGLSYFTFVQSADAEKVRECYRHQPKSLGLLAGAVNSFFVASNQEGQDDEFLDATLWMSQELADRRLFPAIDPLRSTSRLLVPEIVGADHVHIARAVRDAMRTDTERSRKLRLFLTQPFFCAELFSHVPGKRVPRMRTLQVCKDILAGSYDAEPEKTFAYIGDLGTAKR